MLVVSCCLLTLCKVFSFPIGASKCNKLTEFQCADQKSCIHNSWRCDDEEDCLDGSDEQNCSKPSLP